MFNKSININEWEKPLKGHENIWIINEAYKYVRPHRNYKDLFFDIAFKEYQRLKYCSTRYDEYGVKQAIKKRFILAKYKLKGLNSIGWYYNCKCFKKYKDEDGEWVSVVSQKREWLQNNPLERFEHEAKCKYYKKFYINNERYSEQSDEDGDIILTGFQDNLESYASFQPETLDEYVGEECKHIKNNERTGKLFKGFRLCRECEKIMKEFDNGNAF